MADDSFAIAAGGDDGYRYRSSGVYASVPADATGGGDATAALLYATREIDTGPAIYYIANILLRFDTSSLPDSNTVSAASLDIYVDSVGNVDSLSLVGDWYDPGGTQDNSDWANLDAGEDAISGVTIASLTTGAVNNIALSNPTSVNLTGYTGLRLGISKRASDAAPTNFNGVVVASYESANQEPRLNVTHESSWTPETDSDYVLRVTTTGMRW